MKRIVNVCITVSFFFLPCINQTEARYVEWTNPIDANEWQVSGDENQCSLSVEINRFGVVRFQQYAGKSLTLYVQSSSLAATTKLHAMKVIPSVWENFSSYPLDYTDNFFFSSPRRELTIFDAEAVLTALMSGHWVGIELISNQEIIDVKVNNVRLQRAMESFSICKSSLLPMGYDLARDNVLYFSLNKFMLEPESLERLKGVASYVLNVKEANVETILVDGYIEGSNRNGTKMKLSKQISDEIGALLIELGVNPSLIQIRSHGGRFPSSDSDIDIDGRGKIRIRIIQHLGA